METVATYEKVRAAYEDLRRIGQRPSASRIVDLVGGSKSTVLAHLRTMAAEEAAGAAATDPARDLLEISARKMVSRLWDEANGLARASAEARSHTLLAMQAGLFEDLQAAVDAEERATARAEKAEDRIAELETELASRDEMRSQLSVLSELLDGLRKKPEMSAMEYLLGLLADGRRHAKDDVYFRMGQAGYKPGQMQKARFHAIEAKYVVELAADADLGVGFKLSAEGTKRLASAA